LSNSPEINLIGDLLINPTNSYNDVIKYSYYTLYASVLRILKIMNVVEFGVLLLITLVNMNPLTHVMRCEWIRGKVGVA
jgi:hypothetical protein